MKIKDDKKGLNIDPELPFTGVFGYVWFTIKPHWKMFLGYAFFGTLAPFLFAGSSFLYKYVIDAAEARDVQTVIAIAHRLSTLKEMDRIVVLEDGKITEDGTHTALKDTGGTYSRLWGHQAGGFIEG